MSGVFVTHEKDFFNLLVDLSYLFAGLLPVDPVLTMLKR